MSSANLIAIVIGSTGLIGKKLVQLLSKQTNTYSKIVALSRQKENPFLGLTATNNQNNQSNNAIVPIEHVTIDNFDNLSQYEEHFKDISEAYCCLGTTIKKVNNSKEMFRHVDFDYPNEFASLCYKQFRLQLEQEAINNHNEAMNNQKKKQFFIVTSTGADSNSMFFYSQVKGDIETALVEKQTEILNNNNNTKEIYLHICRPGLLLGERQESRIGESIAQGFNSALSWLLPKSISGIEAKDVARAMLDLSERIRNQQEGHEEGNKNNNNNNNILLDESVNPKSKVEKHVYVHTNARLKDFASSFVEKYGM
ncbi:hypothetical protein ABK040_001437 [Willaertia magna]